MNLIDLISDYDSRADDSGEWDNIYSGLSFESAEEDEGASGRCMPTGVQDRLSSFGGF